METARELKQAVADYRAGRAEAFTMLYEKSSKYIYTCIYKVMNGNENVQILIYHTHSQEGYVDSAPGDPNASVVAVGERLAALLRF
jgi:hypothetical protein